MKKSYLYITASAAAVIFAAIFLLPAFFNGNTIPVLNYHQVEDAVCNPLSISTQDFDEQMAYLQNQGYHSITPEQLVSHMKAGAQLPDKPILITFDDGYRDNYTNAFPIMKKYGFTGTIFLITDTLGNDDWYLDWEQLKEMQQSGFVFGSHTLNHVALTGLPQDEVIRQLKKSKEGIEWRLRKKVKYFAYPTGAYDSDIETLVKNAGYEAAFTVDLGRIGQDSNLYELKRIPIFKSRYTFYDFYLRLNYTIIAEKIKMATKSIWLFVHG